MDINRIIETRDNILLIQVLAANKNVRAISTSSYISYCYRGKNKHSLSYNPQFQVSFILDEIENNTGGHDYQFYVFLVLILETSSICRQKLKQKSYDIISRNLDPHMLSALNTIIKENDIGIITKN